VKATVERLDEAGPSLLLRGPVLADLNWLVTLGLQSARQRDGLTPPARLLELQRLIAGAARDTRMSPSGQADVPSLPDSSELLADDWISTSEAAAMTGRSQRQVRRIAPDLGAVRRGQAWVVRRSAVEAHIANQERTR